VIEEARAEYISEDTVLAFAKNPAEPKDESE
jgi:hypothetical protein